MNTKNTAINNNSMDFNSNVLKFITPEEQEHIEKVQYIVSFNKGENIFKQGAPMPYVIVLKSGMAKVFLEDGNNRNIILKIINPGEIVGGPGFFTDYKHHFSVTTIKKCEAHYIDVEEFKKLLLNNAKFGLEMIAYLNDAHIRMYEKLKIVTHKHMNGRLAHTLLYLGNNIYKSDKFDTTLSRQDIADMSSMTKESAIRILKEFKTSKIISCNNNRFEIHDKYGLENILENG